VLKKRYRAMVAEREAKARGEDLHTTIKTGLAEFDRRAGIERSILTVVGAPTGEGKSIFKKHLQEYAAKQGLKCLDLSFEDPPARSADRSFSTATGINNAKMGMGELDDKEMARIAIALDEMEWADRIEYHFGLRTPDEAMEIINASDADLIQVDYAQGFPEGDKGLERTISQFAWDMNVNAQEHNRAVVIYSQVSAEVERRGVRIAEASKRNGGDIDVTGFRPFGNSDLAWSNALGQRAKGLGFLFRPGRYRKRFGENAKDDRMELIFPKKNFGSEGSVIVGFDGRTARLFDLPTK
jgi:replicative DNA helicase